jgi:hypothetical protein
MQLARRKLGNKNTPQSWRLPSPYGCHGAFLPALPHTAICQHAACQVYVVNSLTTIRPYLAHRFFWALFKVNNFLNFCPLTMFDSSKRPLSAIDVVSATIFDGRRAICRKHKKHRIKLITGLIY